MVIEMQFKARLWKHQYKTNSSGRSEKESGELATQGISCCTHIHPGLQEVNWEAAGEFIPQRFPVCFVMLLCSAKCILHVLTKWSSFEKQTFACLFVSKDVKQAIFLRCTANGFCSVLDCIKAFRTERETHAETKTIILFHM